MSTFAKVSVYHSKLRDAGPLMVQFTTLLLESKKRKGKFYIAFKVRGDDTSYTYEPENDMCREALEDVLGAPGHTPSRWYMVHATGRDGDADLRVQRVEVEPRRGAAPAAPAGRSAFSESDDTERSGAGSRRPQEQVPPARSEQANPGPRAREPQQAKGRGDDPNMRPWKRLQAAIRQAYAEAFPGETPDPMALRVALYALSEARRENHQQQDSR